jgi:hypothetical protein
MNVPELPATSVALAQRLNGRAPTRLRPGAPSRGLLITADRALVRAFRRELRRCADCSTSFEVQANFGEARRAAGGPYHWVAVDLDGAIAPSAAVRRVRRSWPAARIAVLSCWWSERDTIAGDRADVVIHKPLRSPELRAFLRSPTGAPRTKAFQAEPSGRGPQDEAPVMAVR